MAIMQGGMGGNESTRKARNVIEQVAANSELSINQVEKIVPACALPGWPISITASMT